MSAISVAVAMTEIATLYSSVYGATIKTEYPNTKFTPPTDPSIEWAKLTIVHSTIAQASLANENGSRRWLATGLGIISLMSPLGAGTVDAYNRAEAVKNLYQGKRTASDVWFKNVRFEERDKRGQKPSQRGAGDLWFQIDVIFNFEYDTIN